MDAFRPTFEKAPVDPNPLFWADPVRIPAIPYELRHTLGLFKVLKRHPLSCQMLTGRINEQRNMIINLIN